MTDRVPQIHYINLNNSPVTTRTRELVISCSSEPAGSGTVTAYSAGKSSHRYINEEWAGTAGATLTYENLPVALVLDEERPYPIVSSTMLYIGKEGGPLFPARFLVFRGPERVPCVDAILDLADFEVELTDSTISSTSTTLHMGTAGAGKGPSAPADAPAAPPADETGTPFDPVITPPPAAQDPREDAAWAGVMATFTGVFAEPRSLPPCGPDTEGRCTLPLALQDWRQDIHRRRPVELLTKSSTTVKEIPPLATTRASDLSDWDGDACSTASTEWNSWDGCTLATLPSEPSKCSAGPRKGCSVAGPDHPPCGPGSDAD